jgi:DNA-binding response OmpR family regulator
MPEMDGLTAARTIRAIPEFRELPIVAMTAHAMSGDREMSIAAGMNDHVNKPINLQELYQALLKWVKPRPGALAAATAAAAAAPAGKPSAKPASKAAPKGDGAAAPKGDGAAPKADIAAAPKV